MQTDVSIILASHNGSDTLPQCLDALSSVDLGDAIVEVLLIDNASDDSTPEILSRYAKRYGWRTLTESRRGKSFALNTAIEAATGKLLVFIDDDVLPDARWLKAYLDASHANPEVGVFAGQIRPKWGARVPGWLERLADDGRCCACTAIHWKAGPYPAIHVKGCNWMIRRLALCDHGFDTEKSNFARSARSAGGEDTELASRLADSGVRTHFVPEARAYHILQPHEVTAAALFRRQIRIGRAGAGSGEFNTLDKILTFPAIIGYALAVSGLLLIGMRTHAAKQFLKIGTRFGRIDRWFLHRY